MSLAQLMNLSIAYDNSRVFHSESMKYTQTDIKAILNSDFNSNLFLKLKEF